MNLISMIVPLGGVVALLFATYLFFTVKKQSPGNKKMQELSKAIREGAMAFLKSEYKVLTIFVIAVAIILYGASFIPGGNMHWGLSVAFIIGAIFSAVSGNVGLATRGQRTLENMLRQVKKQGVTECNRV